MSPKCASVGRNRTTLPFNSISYLLLASYCETGGNSCGELISSHFELLIIVFIHMFPLLCNFVTLFYFSIYIFMQNQLGIYVCLLINFVSLVTTFERSFLSASTFDITVYQFTVVRY